MVWRYASADGIMGHLHICEGIMHTERYIQVLEHPDDVFFRDVPVYSSKTGHSARITTAWLRSKECGYQTGLPAVHTCLPLKMCGAI